ncbi:carbohydrate ABC transporter membrane protein 1 (CUT1 family) [Maritalea mobilis]|uniref:Carbohydrate ABC transporter membrane protein 1 (CUT1 family) n=1 Tax=Maritalea mobilis TaxID=483324 RepID=A0A4R6VKD5_9HYPH|nr:sugar ABC transporter permease [Maritalea mobilis]TDQ62078.1 carbohydrate ABC transporter membrane protein 1 (CUT1 family) [Maritalea mobilis]
MGKIHKDWGASLILLLPGLLLLGAFIFLPLVQTIVWSLFRQEVFGGPQRFIGLSNFSEIWADSTFWVALINNIQFGVLSVVLQVGMGLVLAALLDRGVRRLKVFYRTVIFAPIVVSTAAIGLLWSLFLDPNIGPIQDWLSMLGLPHPRNGILGEPDTALYGVIFVGAWQYTGFMMVILLAGMQSIPEELYEAARMDGCKNIRAFFNITLPLIRNVIVTAILLTVISAFKVFDLVYVLTNGGPGTATEVLASYIFRNAFEFSNIGYANAMSVVFLGIALAFGFVQHRLTRRW